MSCPLLRVGICKREVTVNTEGRFPSSCLPETVSIYYNVWSASWMMMPGWNGESADWSQLSWKATCRVGMWRLPLFVSLSSDVMWPTIVSTWLVDMPVMWKSLGSGSGGSELCAEVDQRCQWSGWNECRLVHDILAPPSWRHHVGTAVLAPPFRCRLWNRYGTLVRKV